MFKFVKHFFCYIRFFFNDIKLRIKENEEFDEKEQEIGHSMAGYTYLNDINEKRKKRKCDYKKRLSSIS